MKGVLISILLTFVIWGTSYGVELEKAIGIWLFDEGRGEVAGDSSGNRNKGEIKGAKWVEGKFGTALEFDGEDDLVEVPDSDTLNPTDKISIVMWIKPYPNMNCDGNNNWRYLICKGNWGSYHVIYESDWALNEIGWTVKIGGANKRLWTNGGAPPDQWTHLAFTYDADKGSKVYRNGMEEPGKNPQGPAKGSVDINPSPLKIGGGFNPGCPAGAGFFKGIIDEVAIFNDVLSQKEIETIMEKGLARTLRILPSVEPVEKLPTVWGDIKAGCRARNSLASRS
ncbi:TPA: LamG domain-containing protein [Candidatus Poribacteria bacterium]|nr:LamG domain-containing protein [Candidatus Poribacteria bacterium]